MNEPTLRPAVWAVLGNTKHRFTNADALVKYWNQFESPYYSVVAFQCMDGMRPGMAGEIRTFVQQWKRWQRLQRT